MIMRTPENIARHELIGLRAKVTKSSNPKNIGMEGRVVDESRDILVLEKTDGKEAKIPKEGSVFLFHIGETKVSVGGEVLVGRPEDRIKKNFKNW